MSLAILDSRIAYWEQTLGHFTLQCRLLVDAGKPAEFRKATETVMAAQDTLRALRAAKATAAS